MKKMERKKKTREIVKSETTLCWSRSPGCISSKLQSKNWNLF